MSPSGRSATPVNYTAFHNEFRCALLVDYGIDTGLIDWVILPRKVPQLYHIWQSLGTKDNYVTAAKQLAYEVQKEFRNGSAEECEDQDNSANQRGEE